MMKRLNRTPNLHREVELSGSNLGVYTEIGARSCLENVEMGDYSYCGPGCIIQNAEIGKFASIAAAVRVGPTKHPLERPTLHHFTYRRVMYGLADEDDADFFAWRAEQVARIGHDTWIGHGAVIMPGVNIGTGAVIGAGTVVTKDIPQYSVAVGVPARVIKERFDNNTANALLEIAWWDWPEELIRDRLEEFSRSAEEFVERFTGMGAGRHEAGGARTGIAGSKSGTSKDAAP